MCLTYRMFQADHDIFFQMPEILLFDLFESRIGEGISTVVLRGL